MFLCTYVPLVLACFCDVVFQDFFLEGIFGFWFLWIELGSSFLVPSFLTVVVILLNACGYSQDQFHTKCSS